MVGGGIFSVLGLAVQVGGSGAYASFALGGAAALLTGYSYAKLSVRYPSRGGTVDFLNRAFQGRSVPGTLNVLLWLGYIVMLALYASALGRYVAGLLSLDPNGGWRHVFTTVAIVAFTSLNLLGSGVVGRAESVLVYVKLAALAVFVAVGLFSVQSERVRPEGFPGAGPIVFAGTLVFLAYEGFELIANAAEEVRDPARNLPLAIYGSITVAIVTYVTVAFTAVGNLGADGIERQRDLALASAAESFSGRPGFVLMAGIAVVSTASALNATLFATPRITLEIALSGELPAGFLARIWGRRLAGLTVTTGGSLLLANLVDVESISLMGSAAFLVIFAATNLANLRLASETGASRSVAVLGFLVCLASLAALLIYAATSSPLLLLVLAGMVAVAIGSQASRPLRSRS